jgi:hypothetical protein
VCIDAREASSEDTWLMCCLSKACVEIVMFGFCVAVRESSNLSRGRDAFCRDIVMCHALSFELVMRLMLEHGCTVLYKVERMGFCSSWYWVYPCSTRVAGAREFRGTRTHASTLARLPKLRRVKHDRSPWRASGSQHRVPLLSFLFLNFRKK